MQVAPDNMEQDAQIVMRVPQVMADRLKEYAAQLSREFGVPVSLAAAARRLLAEGLERAGAGATNSAANADEKSPEDEVPSPKRPVKRKAPRKR